MQHYGKPLLCVNSTIVVILQCTYMYPSVTHVRYDMELYNFIMFEFNSIEEKLDFAMKCEFYASFLTA